MRVVNEWHTRLAPGWPAGPVRAKRAEFLLRADLTDGGTLTIAGTVAIDDNPDIPVGRQVRLFERLSGRLVRSTWSDPVTGAYSFPNLKRQPYFMIAHDYTAAYNAAIRDGVLPV